MDRWMVITCDFEGVQTVGIVMESDFDPEIHGDVMPGSRFLSDTRANMACKMFSRRHGIPEFGTLVMLSMACPQCGNRDMDSLILDDQGICTCHKCGTVYDPMKGGEAECQKTCST
jgi:ribosomal protein S27E